MFTYSQPVRFADIDHAGIVYYPRFFNYFHIAFEELWRQRIGPAAYSKIIDVDRVGFPAVKAECEFKAPLKFGDTADIEVTVPKLGTKSITFRYRIFRSSDRALCAEGTVITAVVDLAKFVAVPIPAQVVEMLRDLVEGQ